MWSVRHALDTGRPGIARGMTGFGENSDAVSMQPISPELALVDPDLAARARVLLPDPPPRRARIAGAQPAARESPTPAHRPYPIWARVTAALWLLVLGILIGGAAIPHAQDTPRVIPAEDDPTFCPAPDTSDPVQPGR